MTAVNRAVWKFPFEIRGLVVIRMPAGAEILFVAVQGDEQPCLWARVVPEFTPVDYTFRLIGTGSALDEDSDLPYVGSLMMLAGERAVFHLFGPKW